MTSFAKAMRFFSFLIFSLVLYTVSCTSTSERENQDQASSNSASLNEEQSSFRSFDPQSGPYDTEYKAPFEQELPPDFFLDTLFIRKEEKKADYTALYPRSNDPLKENFNHAMLADILVNIQSDARFVDDQDHKEASETVYWYSMKPFEFYSNERLISICYIVDSYAQGGNHHNYDWYTFNYDLKNDTPIRFHEVFRLYTEGKQAFSDAVNRNLPDGCKTGTNDDLNNSDFSFVEDGIVINSALSWSCGMQRSLLHKDSAFSFIHPRWR